MQVHCTISRFQCYLLPAGLKKSIVERCKVNPRNAELNPNCHLLALLGAHPVLHVSRIRVKL
jgi:hypothetical protein